MLDIQSCTAEELDQRITDALGRDKMPMSPTCDDVTFCSLIQRYGIAVYPTAEKDDTRGPRRWFGQSYESLGTYSDPDMKVAGSKAILRKLLEIRHRENDPFDRLVRDYR